MMKQKILLRSKENTKELTRRHTLGEIHRVCRGVYLDGRKEDAFQAVRGNWQKIVDYLYPKAVISFRTALEIKPHDGYVFLTYEGTRRSKIELPGLTINLLPGNVDEGTHQLGMKIRISGVARALLENLQPFRKRGVVSKSLGKAGVEEKLCKELELYDEERLNSIRDEAKELAPKLGLTKEFEELNAMIAALLSSGAHDGVLYSEKGVSIAKREPYDSDRVFLFEQLATYLRQCDFIKRSMQYEKMSWKNLSFFESYFSNYIEGTEFEIEEAEDIVFSQQEIENRHDDGHDVMAIFNLVNDHGEMVCVPTDADAFLNLLKRRHAMIMSARLEKRPGEFKAKRNRAGNTSFVSPEHVNATLTRAFDIYRTLPEGMYRALFIHFVISECHPFEDGNGRMARIMMNAELVSVDECRIIIPSVQRDSYLGGLRRVSRTVTDSPPFRSMVKVLDQSHAYSAEIPWHDYEDAKEKLEKDKANLTSDEGLGVFNKVLRSLRISEYPI